MEENNTNHENKTNKVIGKHGGAAGGGMVYILGVDRVLRFDKM